MIFVTGGTGLVGSHIMLKLCQRNIPFKALKRKNSSLDICKDIFIYYKSEHLFNSIIWETGDVNDIPSLENAMKDCDKIIHAAAMVSFHKEDAKLMNKINVEGTKNIMNVAIAKGIKKVSYISSISALGRNNIEKEIIDEECFFKISKKENNYSLSKYFSDHFMFFGKCKIHILDFNFF